MNTLEGKDLQGKALERKDLQGKALQGKDRGKGKNTWT
jgi:hypothetical protein